MKSIILANGFECCRGILPSELVSMTAFVCGSLGSCFGDPGVIFALLDAQLMTLGSEQSQSPLKSISTSKYSPVLPPCSPLRTVYP